MSIYELRGDPEGKPRDEGNEVPWTVGDALTGVILLIPASVLASVVVYVVGLLISYMVAFKISPFLQIITLGSATFIGGIGLAWWLGIRKRGGTLRDLGFTDILPWSDIPLAILGEILVFIGLGVYTFVLTNLIGLKMPEQPVVKLFGRSGAGFAFAVLFIVVLAPLGEEVFFRGFVYKGFRRRWGAGRAMLLSSMIFAVFHIEPLLFLPMFIIGMILSALFEYRRSLAPNILLHGLNNLIALLATYANLR